MFVVREAQVAALGAAAKVRVLRELARELSVPFELVSFCAADADRRKRTQRKLVRELVELTADALAFGADRDEALRQAWSQIEARESFERFQALPAQPGNGS